MCKECGCEDRFSDKKNIEVVSKILDENDKEAAHVREHLQNRGIFAINLMSSPGSGKTTLLEATALKNAFKFAVIEGDLETNNDANRIKAKGIQAYQITTGSACHLDAFMVHEGLHNINLDDLDIVFVENVGNLVCPASYDIGTHLNVVLLSVTEGDDKPAKYPVMFRRADLVIITKSSLVEYFDFDIQKAKNEARKLNPKADIIVLDSKTGENVDRWIEYLKLKLSFRD